MVRALWLIYSLDSMYPIKITIVVLNLFSQEIKTIQQEGMQVTHFVEEISVSASAHGWRG